MQIEKFIEQPDNHPIATRDLEHPWDGRLGYVTQRHDSPSHEAAEDGCKQMVDGGWTSWIVSNDGSPGFVVYRQCRTNFNGDPLQICTVCGRVGVVGPCCGRDSHVALEERHIQNRAERGEG